MTHPALHARSFGAAHLPSVIILHGMLGSSRNWHSVGQALSQTHSVYALDLRNHGDSPHFDAMNHAVMTADILAFMNQQDLKVVHLVGHSLGGKIAMQLAALYPERVQALTVVDISPRAITSRFKAEIEALMSIHLPKLQSRAEADALLMSTIPSAGFRAFLLSNLARDAQQRFYWKPNLPVLHASLAALCDNPLKEADQYLGPTHFIRGAESDFVPNADLPLIARHFPHHRLTTIPNVGHNPHTENLDLFLKAFAQVSI